MAVETGVVMLVYLREAIAERAGSRAIGSVAELREAILEGAIHRLRPKLLTEGTTIIAIAPMLWATAWGRRSSGRWRPPVLGGLLVADEVIDVFLPVLYFAVQKGRWRRLHGLGPFDRRGDGRTEGGARSRSRVVPRCVIHIEYRPILRRTNRPERWRARGPHECDRLLDSSQIQAIPHPHRDLVPGVGRR